ncbi:uncharacterized protein COLE_00281 [Cutaneotrichosporon oleaginosum]|nr:hypothetical protein COLE_00281 [Cutaneotrichosporon oleaginosum]
MQAKLRALARDPAPPRELALDEDLATATRDLNAGLHVLEARMDRQDALIRALTLAVEALAGKVAEQNTQLTQIVAARPDTQMAALRTELGDMGRWCERFNSAYDRTVARCATLEVKLSAANEEVARLREAARVAAHPVERDTADEYAHTSTPSPVHRQVAAVRHGNGSIGRSRRSSSRKKAPSSELVPDAGVTSSS